MSATAFDDMPVGTVLRNAEGDIALKTTNLHRPWLMVFTDGEQDRDRRPSIVGWVELVEKPIVAVPVESERPVDRHGTTWTLRGGFYHPLDACPDDCPGGFTHGQLDERYGPLTEVA